MAGCLGGPNDSDGSDGGNTDGGDNGGPEVRAAFVADGRIGDEGWTYSHEQARQRLEDKYDWLDTAIREEVEAADAEQAMTSYAEDGYDIIFTTSVTFQDSTPRVAEEYPDTYFANANGINWRPDGNMGRYTYRLYEASYATGILAGHMTESNQLGYVGSLAIPLVLRDLNAFALGAASVNPDIDIEVRWTNAFFAPQDAQTIARQLADNGADAFGAYMDSVAVSREFSNLEVFGRNWATELNAEAAGDWNLAVPLVRWDAYYSQQLEAIRDGNWEPTEFWGGLDSGMVELSEYGPQVTDEAISDAKDALERIQSGEFNIWEDSKFADDVGGRPEPGGFVETEMNEYVDVINGEVPN
jgi:basic membrane protein A